MLKNISKIYQQTAFIILAIIISGLLNICLFAFQARAAEPMRLPQFNFAYDNGGNCLTEPMSKPTQAINYPSAPMFECCLAQKRNFDAIINTANDKSTPVFTNLIILSADNSIPKNNYTHNTSRLTYPPPAALALATTVIRE